MYEQQTWMLTIGLLNRNIGCQCCSVRCSSVTERHLGFLKVGNLNFRSHLEAQFASLCQISRRSVEPFSRYSRFSIFKMAAVRHLGFSKVETFNFRSGSEAQCAPSYQISWRSVETLQTSEKVSWEKRTEASKFTKMGTWGGYGSVKVIGNVTIRPY